MYFTFRYAILSLAQPEGGVSLLMAVPVLRRYFGI